MTGEYTVEVYNKRVHYKLQLHRNITILRGNSGTGKSTLLAMIDAYDAGDTASITVKCTGNRHCAVLERRAWQYQIASETPTIFFADETDNFIYTKAFAEKVVHSKHYFVFVTRHEAKLTMIPYSVHEIYTLKEVGKYPVQQRMVVVNTNEPIFRNGLINV